MKKVLLFGGSFDPIHNAHLVLARHAYQELKVDKCYFIIAKNPRWKHPDTTPEERLDMLKLALQDYKEFEISLIEFNSNSDPTYTYDTIVELNKIEQNKYYYLIGSDQEQLLHKWYKIDELSKLVQFVVFKRFGYPLDEDNLKKYHCEVLKSEEFDISSTNIRKLKQINSPLKVLNYIAEHELYYVKFIKQYITDKRLKHSFSVASLAYEIAQVNLIDPNKAYLAGLLHDIAKQTPLERSLQILFDNYQDVTKSVGEWAYHQFVGAFLAEKEFEIEDKNILHAICYHATGIDNMSELDKVIYCADKLDPLRGWDSTKLIEECKKDINQGFISVLKENIIFFKKKNIDYKNNYTLKCLSYYLDRKDYE